MQLITGKYFAALIVAVIAILPTFLYVITISQISTGGIDSGGIMGSYIGLFFLAAVFTAIGVFCSSLTSNPVVSFLLSAFACYIIYSAFTAISALPVLQSGTGYFIELLGINSHYRSISRGVIDSRDVIYFLSVIFFFLFLTAKNLLRR